MTDRQPPPPLTPEQDSAIREAGFDLEAVLNAATRAGVTFEQVYVYMFGGTIR